MGDRVVFETNNGGLSSLKVMTFLRFEGRPIEEMGCLISIWCIENGEENRYPVNKEELKKLIESLRCVLNQMDVHEVHVS